MESCYGHEVRFREARTRCMRMHARAAATQIALLAKEEEQIVAKPAEAGDIAEAFCDELFSELGFPASFTMKQSRNDASYPNERLTGSDPPEEERPPWPRPE